MFIVDSSSRSIHLQECRELRMLEPAFVRKQVSWGGPMANNHSDKQGHAKARTVTADRIGKMWRAQTPQPEMLWLNLWCFKEEGSSFRVRACDVQV